MTDLHALSVDADGLPARALVASLGLHIPVGERPRLVAAMVMSADGRAQLADRSVGLGNPADRDLLRELRAGADGLLAGSRTLLAERYATLLDDEQRRRRLAAGLTAHPVVITVSRDLSLPVGEIPLFAEAGVPVIVATEEPEGGLGEHAADVRIVRYPRGGLSLPMLLADLRRDHGISGITCEGGPHLLRELVARDCVDDLLLTVAPKLVGGDRLSVLEGEALAPRGLDLDLVGIWRSEDHLFLRYQRSAP